MVATVEVDAVPAGREESLCSHTIARFCGKAVGVATVIRIQAYVLHGLVCKKRLIDCSEVSRISFGTKYG